MNNKKRSPKRMQGGDYMEPSKELQFGGPSHRVKAKKGRRKAGDGDTKEERSPLQRIMDLPGQISKRFSEGSKKLEEKGAAGADMMERERAKLRNTSNTTSRTSSSNADRDAATASGNRVTTQRATSTANNTGKGSQSAGGSSAQPKKNPYAEAKKRDSNLDSYIKQRNAAEKGSLDYNEAQNKINKAYGKGPTNRITTYGPEKKGETAKAASTGKSAATAMASQSKTKPTLQTNMVSTSKPAAKPPAEPTGRAKKIQEKTDKKVGRIQDRRASAANRESARGRKDTARQAAKDSGATRGQARAAGKMAKAGVKGKEKKFDRQYEKFGNRAKVEKPAKPETPSRSERRAPIKEARAEKRTEIRTARGKQPRRKALIGDVVKQGLDLASKIAPEGSGVQKFAQGASEFVNNPVQFAVNKVTGGGQQQQQQQQTTAAPAPAPAAAPQPAATGQPDQQQTMKRGGKKRKMMGGKRMKYKTGNFKPDYLDMDKDGNKTESMKSALKDRRAKAKKGRYKAQQGTITPEGARQKTYYYNKTKERQERNASQARNKRLKEVGKAVLSAATGNVAGMAAAAAKNMKNKK